MVLKTKIPSPSRTEPELSPMRSLSGIEHFLICIQSLPTFKSELFQISFYRYIVINVRHQQANDVSAV